jgi:hypothetical protein
LLLDADVHGTSTAMAEVFPYEPERPTLATRVRDVWCRLFHRRVLLPIHGYYQCRRCLRRYPMSLDSERPAIDRPHKNRG